jgi:hypothetical protein
MPKECCREPAHAIDLALAPGGLRHRRLVDPGLKTGARFAMNLGARSLICGALVSHGRPTGGCRISDQSTRLVSATGGIEANDVAGGQGSEAGSPKGAK